MWEDLAPFFVVFGLLVIVPIVSMMTKHQRKMAELLHRNQGPNEDRVLAKLDQMQREIERLKERQNEIILAVDNRSPIPSVEQRIQE
ncbi:MAG TPA: hypothetical protein VNI20_00975 [Fimbriimonadaceae bacterium]|nr:hypothetical protein [Fimbriimonadaceae bacterium]